ncbi:hypothetical protein [Croceimicrobium hydrocarbonivorans]|uniref:Uncharacterized protein n=1 Tax=Croceimicrobium hydrocarbonivorans TaxID=2761580 RepID=A0A7H0VAS0_9FLAO|nr:hypothetical protein [Croceimicrobium hydrocarbonivorans]QNR22818.1 hypothetical protein H4K34_10545 [Croceimicrobium hydrocarbonivorans]
MKDNVRQELKELCYFIIENNNALSRPEQLTRVQMLYERLLVLNYLEEVEAERKSVKASSSASPAKAEAPAPPPPAVEKPQAPEFEKPAPKIEEAPAEPEEIPNEAIAESPEPEVPAQAEAQPMEMPLEAEASQEEEEAPQEEMETAEAPLEKELPKAEIKENTEAKDLNAGHQAPKSVNDQLAKGAIQVGLNDRIAFVKHLFNDSQSDFNRVLSQLNTLDTYLESMYFIENLVKPDYDWDDKKPYEERLINLVKKRFGEDW